MTDDALESAEGFTRRWTGAQPAVSAYVAAFVADFRDVQEIVQNAAVAALRKYDTYDPERSFLYWTLGIARFEVLRHLRRTAKRPLLADDRLAEEIASACEELSDQFQQRSQFLAECLELLDGRSAELVRLRYEEALKPSAIAMRTGMGSIAVRVALSRIRSILRQCIEGKLQSE